MPGVEVQEEEKRERKGEQVITCLTHRRKPLRNPEGTRASVQGGPEALHTGISTPS